MNRMLTAVAYLFGAVVFGAALAAIAEFAFFVGPLAWLNLVFWGLIAIVLGFVLRTWAMAIAVCAVLGFTIVVSYSIMGYHGSAPLSNALSAFAVLGVAGAIGMAAAGAVAHLLRQFRTAQRAPQR
ncbi:hypothetical protein G3T36_02255 [Diaminobutyricibacter tongyongensis]|uniref:Uncharacterized protein n=1 Tax=Leifsonia tongyongensis TaxID=1268043 RepID=A0A6L9XTI4_9MICO|nr:hypothetical protein [Diaminobutyricibacter tongyongensis]NEN04683.1 hypothetical protein [Diaminobutyricibacter tongyongensis]